MVAPGVIAALEEVLRPFDTPPYPEEEWEQFLPLVPESVLRERSRTEVDYAAGGTPVPITVPLLTPAQRRRAEEALTTLQTNPVIQREQKDLQARWRALQIEIPLNHPEPSYIRRAVLWEACARIADHRSISGVAKQNVMNYLWFTTLFPAIDDEAVVLQLTQMDTRVTVLANLSTRAIPYHMPPGCIIIDVSRATEKDAAALWTEIQQVQRLFGIQRDVGGRPEKGAIYQYVAELRRTHIWRDVFHSIQVRFGAEAPPSEEALKQGFKRWKQRTTSADGDKTGVKV